MQMGHSAGGVDSLRKASGLFNTHSRVKEVGTDVAAAVLEAPVVVSFVAVRLALEFFFVMLVVFYTTREKNARSSVMFSNAGGKRGCPVPFLL